MPAMLPAAFVAWHYVVQLSRPRWGYGSDMGGQAHALDHRRHGRAGAGRDLGHRRDADAEGQPRWEAIILALVAFSMIGAGVGAAGTSLLALLASRVAPERRPAAASITWIMMIVGIVVSAGVSGALLQPFSAQRLAHGRLGRGGRRLRGRPCLAVWGAEKTARSSPRRRLAGPRQAAPSASDAHRDVGGRAGSAVHDLRLRLHAGLQRPGTDPGALRRLGLPHERPANRPSSPRMQHGGVLLGMILVGVLGARFGDRKRMWMRSFTVAGCVGSAVALARPLHGELGRAPRGRSQPTVFILGVANGVFAVSAIGSMMGLAGAGGGGREGVRMGVWGAAQAGAFAVGGFVGATGRGRDARACCTRTVQPSWSVFVGEAAVFLAAAILAARVEAPASVGRSPKRHPPSPSTPIIHGSRARMKPSTEDRSRNLRRRRRRRRPLRRHGGGGLGARRPQGAAAGPRRANQALRRRHPAPADPRLPHSRLAPGGPRHVRPHDRPQRLGRWTCPWKVASSAWSTATPFDEWLRARAAAAGAERRTGDFQAVERDSDGCAVVRYATGQGWRSGGDRRGAPAAWWGPTAPAPRSPSRPSRGPRRPSASSPTTRSSAPRATAAAASTAARCDVFYQGKLSPDFYAWIFPHGETASIGVGSARKGFSLRRAIKALRASGRPGRLRDGAHAKAPPSR